MLDLEVIVVDAPDREGELGGVGFLVLLLFLEKAALRLRRLCLLAFLELLADDGLQPLRGGLNGALVDIAADPSATELLGYGGGGAGAEEGIENDVPWAARSSADPF